jgi:DDE_Tnp_1-associated/Transposase DDE domain
MAAPLATVLDAFSLIDDPRKPRGVRHPYASLLALTFLGLLCRQVDFASLQRWAEDHWKTLKDPLGFTRQRPPHATTLSRDLARCSREQFRDVFARWLVSRPQTAAAVTVAVDGKTSKQGRDAQGDPIPMLNVFAHDLKLCLAQFPVTDGKPTEPQTLKHGLTELLDHYPFLRLFTGDALFCQRPLAQVLLDADRDFLFAVKDNQPELLEAIQTSFHHAPEQTPDAKSVEKKGRRSTPGGSGSRKARKLTTFERRPTFRASI